jgi:hypothetical protein
MAFHQAKSDGQRGRARANKACARRSLGSHEIERDKAFKAPTASLIDDTTAVLVAIETNHVTKGPKCRARQ